MTTAVVPFHDCRQADAGKAFFLRVLTADEEKLYLLAASRPLRDVATMLLETGMRPDEVCRIRRVNVHLEQGYVFNPFGKTKAARRKVPLTERAIAVLVRLLEKVKGDFLFPARTNLMSNSLNISIITGIFFLGWSVPI